MLRADIASQFYLTRKAIMDIDFEDKFTDDDIGVMVVALLNEGVDYDEIGRYVWRVVKTFGTLNEDKSIKVFQNDIEGERNANYGHR